MSEVIHSKPSDSPGYVSITLDEPIGRAHAGAQLLIDHPEHKNTGREDGKIVHILHGQRELDVLAGSTVEFPDGTSAEV